MTERGYTIVEQRGESDPGLTFYARALLPPSGRRSEGNVFGINLAARFGFVLDSSNDHSLGYGAESTAKKILDNCLRTIDSEDPDTVSRSLREAFEHAHQNVLTEKGRGRLSATAAKIVEVGDERRALIASVGLTRAYIVRDGEVDLITRDHGVPIVESYEEVIQSYLDTLSTLEDVRAFGNEYFGTMQGQHFWENRFKARYELGGRMPSHIPVYEVPVEPHDRLVIVSSGMQNLTQDELSRVLTQQSGSFNPAEALAHASELMSREYGNVRAANRDHTAVVIDINERMLDKWEMHKVAQGGSVMLEHVDDQPIFVVMPDGQQLEIGMLDEIGLHPVEGYAYGLINRTPMQRTGGQSGGYALEDSSCFIVGKGPQDLEWRVHKGEYASQLRVQKDGPRFTFQDMHTREGVTVMREKKKRKPTTIR